ncbi:ketoacyl-ACP synthase III [Amycolatopsis sp. K13G38]|uniref:Ketoacyl-ACP synthase III n=1 Tax=Amycolatopsis acididurans TaxID=2724524 RepID=A0ABX1J952_9PSEU|nr:ketoacyl-ACP synthase III [Amycolatopsis acididurans]NKQ55010.1 ketoacyl-ACP synthase III [Amycolatopsis acididurans]
MSQASIGILGTGSYLPERVITNEEIASRVGTTVEWIERKTQIRTRRYAAPSEATSDLGARAGIEAIKQAGISADQIDYIIVSTSTPDSPQPPTANLIQHELQAHNAACFDVNAVCSGFIYALALAQGLLTRRPDRLALVIASDVYSRSLDFDERRTAVLLGDGAGAAIVGGMPPPYGIIDFTLLSDGDAHELIRVDAGGSRKPASHETVDSGGHFFTMRGREVRDFVLERVPPALDDLLAAGNVPRNAVDHIVPHQPNGNLLDDLQEKLGLRHAIVHRTVVDYGNVGSASVPLTLDVANRTGAFRDGQLVLLASFGGGMAIGASLLRWMRCG